MRSRPVFWRQVTDLAPDGYLSDWSEIAHQGWKTLVVGNGLSINVSRYFAYESLFEEAGKSLDDGDRAIFESFDTTNFEVVLAKLRDGITLAEVLGRQPGPYRRRFQSVQAAFGVAIRRVHLERSEVPDETRKAIKLALRAYDTIFSTSYDLLIYWSIAYNDSYGLFCDCFWGNDRNEFDPDDCEVFPRNRPIYYLHGALHLVVEGSGVTRKLTSSNSTLLDQFGKPIPGDPEARPLLITEASARDKLRAIEGNDYLSHAYERLQENDRPLVVFGHSLSSQDRHLIDAINANPDRPVAISMMPKAKSRLREQKAEIWGKLRSSEVLFFDATTHPLGSSGLTVEGGRRRFLGKWYPLKK